MSTYVYVCLDADRKPLYVGCTTNVKRRMKEHRIYMPWPAEVAHLLTTEFDTRAKALAAERERIESLRPRWNKRWNPAHISLVSAIARQEWVDEFNAQFTPAELSFTA